AYTCQAGRYGDANRYRERLTGRPRHARKGWKQRTSVVLRQHSVTLVASARRCRNQPPTPELLCCGRPKVPFLPQYTWPRFGGAFLPGTNPRARNCFATEERPERLDPSLSPARRRAGLFSTPTWGVLVILWTC